MSNISNNVIEKRLLDKTLWRKPMGYNDKYYRILLQPIKETYHTPKGIVLSDRYTEYYFNKHELSQLTGRKHYVCGDGWEYKLKKTINKED